MTNIVAHTLSIRAENKEFARRIAELVPEGLMAPEIAARLGIPHRRVHRIAKRAGIELPRGLGANARCVRVVVPSTLLPALDEIAAGAKVERSEMARRIMISVLDTSRAAALKQLGRLGQPKRGYRSREEIERDNAAAPAKRPTKEERARAAAAAEEQRIRAEAESRARMPAWLRDAITAGENPIRAARLHAGLRQIDVAARLGLGRQGDKSVRALELGHVRLTPRMAERLAKAMGVEPAWLSTSSVPN